VAELTEACRLRDRLLAHSSHEIRQPLGSIVGAADWLLGSTRVDAHREALELVRHSGLALLSMVNDLVDFARIETGALRLVSAPFDLRGTLEDALGLAAQQTRDRDVELTAYMEEDVPRHVVGDAGRLRQILLNLVNNALRYTLHGHVTVEVSRLPSGRKLRFLISDTGVGLAPGMQSQLFTPFADRSHAGEEGGGEAATSGLGLWICRQLVELMDGTIGVESEPGKGTQFWFTADLPVEPVTETPLLRFNGQAVLLRERHPLTRRAIAGQLRRLGLEVHTCGNNEDLMRLRQRADVILLGCSAYDHETSEIDRVVTELRADTAVPVLVLTARDDPAVQLRLRRLSVDLLLTKPLREQSLTYALGRVLKVLNLSEPRSRAAEPEPGFAPHVLLVEDHPGQRRIVSELLAQQGARVVTAGDAPTALDLLRHLKVDCVLMDMHLPVMNGIEATRTLRNQLGREAPPVIGMTGDVLPERLAAFKSAGVEQCLTKPLTGEMLWTTVRTVCGQAVCGELPAVVDSREALARAGGDPALAREVLQMLQADLDRDLPLMTRALTEGKFGLVADLAHAVAGTATYCGAGALRAAASGLERSAAAADVGGAARRLESLRQEVERLRAYAGAASLRSTAGV
jgi:CheY-like chemotaxis protein